MVDYSKWKNIEISDDEDETHPNIDTPSLFRWRHQARIERMEEQKREKEEFEKAKERHRKKIQTIKTQINETEKSGGDVSDLKTSLEQLELEDKKLSKKEEDLKVKEKVTPWNVDTISKPGFTKTVVNKLPPKKEETLTEEEFEQGMKQFIKDNEKVLKEYGMLRKYDSSKQFLLENPQLVCEYTANYLVIWCINLEMEEKLDLSHHVAHQCICMQYILELSKHLDVDPRACVSSFFSKIQIAEAEYQESFNLELDSLKQRISARAKEKLEQAIKEAEEEERKARLGPGGLDPVEVFESLPDELKTCFETQDTGLLQETLSTMSLEDAAYHMKRCVDSGLWIPDAKTKQQMIDRENAESCPVIEETPEETNEKQPIVEKK